MPANRFGFKLDALHKLRRQQRDQKQRLLAEAVRRLSTLQKRLASLNDLKSDHLSRARDLAAQPRLDVPELSRHRYWTAHLERGALETESQIRSLSGKLFDDRRGLVEADRRLKVIDKLRDKALYRYQREQLRLEVRDADEMSLRRYLMAGYSGSAQSF